MLDPRLYRVAFVPVLFAVLITAFSLAERPRPIGTTLAPDTFYGQQTLQTLDSLAARFPERRPGSVADGRLADEIARRFERSLPGSVRRQEFEGRTIDGRRSLVNVIATRPGKPGPAIAVVAHRDAAAPGARGELSATATLLGLAEVAGAGRFQRTVTFVSTSGGSGGFAGAQEAVAALGRDVDAVIVLGAVGVSDRRPPLVIGSSDGLGQAPIQLQRTVQEAIRTELGSNPGAQRATVQALRMVTPGTRGEQGVFLRSGLPAVLVSGTGERAADAGAPVDAVAIERLGRGVLRALYALDNGPDISSQGPTQDIVLRGRVLPGWTIRLLVLTLLLGPLLVAVDGAARLRRRREPLAGWMVWALSPALALVVALSVAAGLAAVDLIAVAPPAPLSGGEIALTGGVAVAAVVLVLVAALCWLFLRPALLTRAGIAPGSRPDAPGAGVALGLLTALTVLLLWIVNPYAAAAFVPAAHLWLWAAAPETRLRRAAAIVLYLLGLGLPVAVLVADAQLFSLSALEVPWFWVLMVAGGSMPWWAWLAGSLVLGVAVSAAIVVVRRSGPPAPSDEVTVRGPRSYAGPGSLGGTSSALRG